MKKISVVVPTFNEEDNIENLNNELVNIFENNLKEYDYEIIFIDNNSLDNSKKIIKKICNENSKIKAIFNTRNFGQFNSPYYGLLQTSGDCALLIAADFQDPLNLIPVFVEEWEKSYKIVIGIKTSSNESKIFYFVRSMYYKLIKFLSNVEQIEHFTGFGLYDKDFINILRSLDDSKPYLRGLVADVGFKRKEIEYNQLKRRAGKTSNNFFTLYDAAMVGFTAYTKTALRFSVFLGFTSAFFSFIVGIIYLVYKINHWYEFDLGLAPLVIGLFFLNSIVLFFLGFLGEYVLNINERINKRPLVIEEERINFN